MCRRVAALTVCVLAGAQGCGSHTRVDFRDTPGSGPVTNPFVPASMVIHPLTRVDADAKSRQWLFCHVEFKDSWGDTVKAVGKLTVELYRPTGPRSAGLGRQELVWTVDMSDLERNASLYDPATRTYRLPLENPPTWLTDRTPDQPRGRLRAVFVTGGAREGTRTLEAEFVVGR